eukprot:m.69630 g.69630  ORF g.69630 m.69630 type:complete len:158 (+) comp16788_c0_seq2:532-1005(+)
MSDTAEHEPFIKRTVELAQEAVKEGNHPFGALLLGPDGQIVLEAKNTTGSEHDATRHAELNLVSIAARKFERSFIEKCTLYASTEPCMMCCGALYWTGVRRVVFSCPHDVLGKHAGAALLMSCERLLAADGVQVVGPVLCSLGESVHVGFWSGLGHT